MSGSLRTMRQRVTRQQRRRLALPALLLAGLALLALPACSRVEVAGSGHAPAAQTALGTLAPGEICSLAPEGTSAGFFLLLTTGLLTGLSHCVGMCGPLVSAFAVRQRAARAEVTSPLLVFQMGRLTTYMLLGAGLGAAGSVVKVAALDRGWQGGLSVGLGVMLLLSGVSLLGRLPWQHRLAALGPGRLIARWLGTLLGAAARRPAASFGLGLANGLLPCGAVYAVALLAASTGDPLRGATGMLVFGLGTLPALLGVGLSVSRLSLRLRGGLYRMTATLVMLAGLQLALRGLALAGQMPHAVLGGVMLW